MTPFAARATFLFALAATIPVALTAIVWLGVTGFERGATTSEASLARTSLERLDAQRVSAVDALCRDDLAVDRLLRERSQELPPELDYDRLFQAAMAAGGLDVLWVIDPTNAEIVARGHRQQVLADGSELSGLVRDASGRTFGFYPGAGENQRFLVRGCTIERGGARVQLVGGHRLSTLRDLDAEQIFVTETAREADELLLELQDARGAPLGSVVWRPRLDRRGPPLLLWIVCVAVLALGLALLFGGYLNRWLRASEDELAAAATRVGRGDFDTTLRDDARGAFPATATAFNRMTRDLRDARAQLRQTERVAAWQDIAKSLAHELKNPLSPIRLSIETLRKAHSRSHEDFDALFDESTRTILQEVDRLRHIVDEFSRFARLPAPKLRPSDLRGVLSQAVLLHAEGPVPIEVILPDREVRAEIDPEQITQVLHNLLQNASDAALAAHPDGGAKVSVTLEQRATLRYIHVDDNGPGIPPSETSAIFEPYYTRKEGGTGLGLAISHRIITEHKGRISVHSTPPRTRFTLELRDTQPP